jgi:geranylgeranyl reductase family protein
VIPVVYDIAIVGAGPAGSWTARQLAARGARVVLLDPSHPREKPCGGGVTGRALALVAGAVDRLAAVPITSARFVDTAQGRSARVPLHADGVSAASDLLVASRNEFDGGLLEAARTAGATFLPSRVRDIEVTGERVRLRLDQGTCEAGFLVGADGANSLVRRRVAQPFRRDQLSTAAGFFAHGTTSDEIVLEVTSDPPGYFWSFPRPGHLAIGVCAQSDSGVAAATLRARTAQWIRNAGLAPDARLQAYGWPIPSLGVEDFAQPVLAGPRWCLVGDAAGLVDPITREGIYFALRSAEFAADALGSGHDPARVYANAVRTAIVPELARAARLKAGFFRPRFARLFIDAVARSARVRQVVADLVAGRQGYHDLKWRLLKTFELPLVISLFRG